MFTEWKPEAMRTENDGELKSNVTEDYNSMCEHCHSEWDLNIN